MIYAIILVLFLIIYLFTWEDPPKNFPPGPKRLRYFGNIHQYLSLGRIKQYEALTQFSKIYGSIYGLKMGSNQLVIINDLETIKKTLNSDDWTFRFGNEWISQTYGNKQGLLFSDSTNHREIRQFTVKTLRGFGFGRGITMESTFKVELNFLISRINQSIDGGSSIFPMRHFFTIPVLNLIWCLIARQRFDPDDPKIREMITILDRLSKYPPNLSDPMLLFPILRWAQPYTKKGKIVKEVYLRINSFFKEIINSKKNGVDKNDSSDFFDVFLDEIHLHRQNSNLNEVSHFTEEQLTTVAFDLFGAGSETSSNALEFAFLYMLKYPEVQRKVQDEIDLVVGSSRFPNLADRPRMPYTNATLLEALRLAPPVPLLMRSPSNGTTSLGPYKIPKGVMCILNIYAANMSKDLWGDAENFRPERFLDFSAEEIRLVNSNRLFPFGAGKRACIGEVLARGTIFVVFATLLQRFKWEIPPGAPPLSTKFKDGFTISPRSYSALITPR